MRIPGEGLGEEEDLLDRSNRMRRPRAMNYDQEMNQRRRQERIDEILARRLQRVVIDDGDDYNGGIGDINGIGNGAGHFMNEDYVRRTQAILTGANVAANYVIGVNRQRGIPPPAVRARGLGERYPTEQSGPSPPQMLRRPSVTGQPLAVGPVDRLIPRRASHDYAPERAVHAPRSPPRPVSRVPSQHVQRRAPKDSVLAGLGGSGRGSNRVGAWRSHVEPGVVPAEGFLSVVD